MILITLAHLGEAEELIKNLELHRVNSSYFQGPRHALLLTGEGPFEAAIKTSAALAREKFAKVINIGICGSLDASLQIKQIHKIRTIYLVVDGKPQFKSFSTGENGVDLITSFERILQPEKARVLSGVGKLVDREAWGVAMAAKEAGVPFECFKVISDVAGSVEACELVREKAQEFAEIISEMLVPEEKPFIDPGKEFHFTFTTRHAFETKLRKLALRQSKKEEEVLRELEIEELKTQKLLPKERTRRLLAQIDQDLDPFKGQLSIELQQWKESWGKKGIHLITDPTFESEAVRVSFEARNQAELEQRLRDLAGLELVSILNKVHN